MSEVADAGPPLFAFAQLEFPWALGPADGRYVLRAADAGEPSHVLVLTTLGAAERRRLGRRRPRATPADPSAAPVATARATVIDAGSLPDEGAGAAWLQAARGAEVAERRVAAALATLNGVLRAHRVAAADPHVREVARGQALVARLGWGRGEQVADGRWTDALEVPPPREGRRRRTAALRPQERLAALVGGRELPLVCEELALRARLDLDQGRPRAAALQLRVALEAALTDLAEVGDAGDLGARLAELRSAREAVGQAANEALRGPLEPASAAAVGRVLGRLEAALRARAAAGDSGVRRGV